MLPYRIDFENDAQASAPPQVVTISNQLADSLDWSSVRLTEIGFGEENIAIPADSAQSFETRVPMRYQGVDFEVEVRAGIDTETGEVTASFYSYLPDSELPPPVEIGFLPPEDGTGRGMGHIGYTVEHDKGLADGTEIRNIARIVFDLGEEISTNQVDPHDPGQGTDPAKEALVTIDALVAHGEVSPLPEVSTSRFTVYWGGTDSASGVAGYDVFVREGEGQPWSLWLEDTGDTHGVFFGEVGKSYQFYSLATDRVGHVEQKSPRVEAQTLVDTVAADLILTGVIDGPLADGTPKAVEIHVLDDIAELSLYGLGIANDGGGSDGVEFGFPAVSASAGDVIYVASEATGFMSFFGFPPDYTSAAVDIDGDDAVELFKSGSVVDVFGEIAVDGTGQPWEYTDSWAYRRAGTGPDGTSFVLASWTFGGPDSLDGETSNGSAATPFPIGTYADVVALSAVGSASPATLVARDPVLLTVAVTPATAPNSTGISVLADLSEIGGSASQAFFDDGTHGDATGGDNLYSFATTVIGTPGSKSLPVSVTDNESRSASVEIALAVIPEVAIYEIQGSGQYSAYAGQSVQTEGVVTLVSRDGKDAWIQDPYGDGDPATSDGILLGGFDKLSPPPAIGDLIVVQGKVEEEQYGNELPRTRLAGSALVEIGSSGQAVTPVTLTDLPDLSIPEGIGFWEPLEGMRVSLYDAIVVAPTSRQREFGLLTAADAVPGSGFAPSVSQILLRSIGPDEVDYNPERILIGDAALETPDLRPGDLVQSAAGIVDYSFGSYKLALDSLGFSAQPLPVPPVSTRGLLGDGRDGTNVITSFDVGGLFDLEDDPDKADEDWTPTPAELQTQLTKLALAIEQELELPDILVLQEVENTAIAQELGNRVNASAGTDYVATSFETSDERGIEVAFLWDADRAELLDAYQLTGPDVEAAFGSSSASPGREPLYGKFQVHDEVVQIIGNDFKSKDGDDPIFGISFNRPTEVQRKQQAHVVRDFVDGLLATDPDALVMVTGDLNDFPFGEPGEGADYPLAILEGAEGSAPLTNLIELESEDERWSYISDGNSEVLDHMLVNEALRGKATGADFLHFNAAYPDSLRADPSTTLRASDHDPLEGRFALNEPPVAAAGGPYLVPVLVQVVLDASGSSDPDGDPLTEETWTAEGGTVSGNIYTAGSEAGIYDVQLVVNDGLLDSQPASTTVVVYDPAGGFVTGGGWIDSPSGAYKPDPSLTGKASFGFVSKYKKGAQVPTGTTEFRFKAGDLDFHSDSYEWLVVNQGGTNAQFKGSGTINGDLDPNGNPFEFMLWAGDGASDSFRIRIWWEADDDTATEHDVYDNGVAQAIAGGSIIVHTGK